MRGSVSLNEIISTDVLVIGGGAAGIRAAIEANDNGADVLLVVKGKFAKTGSSFFSLVHGWGIQAVFKDTNLDDSTEKHLEEILEAGLGMCDVKLARILVEEAPQRVMDLKRYGIEFKKENGEFVQQVGCFSKKPRAIAASDMKNIRSTFRNEIIKRNIKVLENTMVFDLLTINNTCVGALCIKDNGDIIAIKAKSTILATGGASTIFKNNLNSPELTGDGQIMAINAGAELLNMEFIQFIYGIVYPKKLLFAERVLEFCPKIYNRHNELYLEGYLPDSLEYEEVLKDRAKHGPFSSRSISKYFDIATYKEIMKRNCSEHGGVYIDLSAISNNKKMEKYPFTKDWIRWLFSQGIDPNSQILEIAPHAHAFNGGVRVNERAETKVKGLFAAGEIIGGPHGADRLGGNMMSLTQVFGARAGKYAAIRSKKIKEIPWNEESIKRKYSSITKLTKAKNGIKPDKIDEEIKRLMWENVAICRNEKGLSKCIEKLEEIGNKYISNIAAGNIKELKQAISVRNKLTLSKIIANSALIRKESRGSHYREDFPDIDNNEFNKCIIVEKEGEKILYKLESVN